MLIPSATAKHAEADLADELPARAEVEEVVDGAERRGRRAADQQRGQLARQRRAQRLIEPERPSQPTSSSRDEDQRDREERRRDRDARRRAGSGRR